MREAIDRRKFLTGRLSAMSAGVRHISSALVLALPERRPHVVRLISEMPGTEVHGIESGKIIVVLEAESTDEIGERMIAISLLDGVIAANLVFEQICDPDAGGANP